MSLPSTASTRTIFRGSFLRLDVDTVDFPDGSSADLEIVRHRGAAAALPILAPERRSDGGTGPAVVLLLQYRHAAQSQLWEIPAGKLENDEAPEACARRELREEAGIQAESMTPLARLLTTPGFTDESIDLFVARGLSFVATAHERHETIEVHIIDLERAVAMVDAGEIVDGKTMVAILMAAQREDLWRAG